MFGVSGTHTAVSAPSVRNASDGYAASDTESPRAFLQGSVPPDGLLHYVHNYLNRGHEAVGVVPGHSEEGVLFPGHRRA